MTGLICIKQLLIGIYSSEILPFNTFPPYLVLILVFLGYVALNVDIGMPRKLIYSVCKGSGYMLNTCHCCIPFLTLRK